VGEVPGHGPGVATPPHPKTGDENVTEVRWRLDSVEHEAVQWFEETEIGVTGEYGVLVAEHVARVHIRE